MNNFSTLSKNILIWILIGLLLACGYPLTGAQAAGPTPTASPGAPSQAGCDTNRSVQVSGSAAINLVPDRALIQLGVQSNGVTTTDVELANTTAIRKIINALEASGIAAKDIGTDRYIIEPLYDDYDSLYIKGYRIHNVIAITLREVDQTSSTIATALRAGANQVLNVEFYSSNLRKYRDQARSLAMQAATEKAQALAEAAGAKAGCVLHINENSWSYYSGWYGRSSSQWTQNTVQNAAPTSAGEGALSETGPVSLGQISIQAQVELVMGLD